MAYVSQDKKAKIAAALKAIPALKAVKYSLAVRHHSTIVMSIRSGSVDFIANYNETMAASRWASENQAEPAKDGLDVNPYHFRDMFTGETLDLVTAIFSALNTDNHNRSDSQTDYFDVGHYVTVHIGHWSKPYVLTAAPAKPAPITTPAPVAPRGWDMVDGGATMH